MTYSYYPGCTLKTKAKELDRTARLCAEKLGANLRELDNWQCCGGAYTASSDEIATKLSSVRALLEAESREEDIITLCSACHNVLKRVRNDLTNDANFAFKVNNYVKPEKPFEGKTRVIHFLEFLRDEVGFDNLREKVVNPFTGKKIAAYYGCLLLRPSGVMDMDDPENPKILEDFIRAIGGEPVMYPYRNECCGGYVALEDKSATVKKSEKIVASADGFGADIIITACPLCLYNLESAKGNSEVKYFTELLAHALGIKEA
ncbi:MAG: CoB--CoM heterodisulfide reductase iron-sulfur subunit B family protein [Clostridia bacterium]|nr:CoB--CoM heterodisulfide reductase iron-sulfur subunit B family protein [Clostridia bacterium]